MSISKTKQYEPGRYAPPPDKSASVKRKLDRLWKQFMRGELTVDQWADAANRVDPPVLVDRVNRKKVV